MLPAELYYQIIQHLDFGADLSLAYSLLLTSRIFYTEIEPILYRTFTVQDLVRQTLFLERIVSSERIASFVHTFHVLPRWSHEHEQTAEWKRYAELLEQGLGKMSNLQLLRTSTSWTPLWITHAQLTGIEYGPLLNFKDDRRVENMASFLVSQLSLRSLVIGSLPWHRNHGVQLDLPQSALPNLKSLCAHTAVVDAVLPGRQVTTLKWQKSDFEDGSIIWDMTRTSMIPALHNLQVLVLSTYRCRSHLSQVVEYLTGLEYLELCGVQNDHEPFQATRLTSLKSLTLTRCSVRGSSSRVGISASLQLPLVDHLSQYRPSLKRLIIELDKERVPGNDIEYGKWTRQLNANDGASSLKLTAVFGRSPTQSICNPDFVSCFEQE